MFCEDILRPLRFVVRRTFPGGVTLSKRGSVITNSAYQDARPIVCAIEHIKSSSVQVGIGFGFYDGVAFAGLRFQAPPIKKRDQSSTVTN